MCARVEIDFNHPVYNEIKQRLLKKYPNLNILSSDYFPSQSLPLIYLQGEYDVGMFNWGYNNLNNKQKIINARAESIEDKFTFKEDFIYRRALLPVTGFYEWNKAKEKFHFVNKNENEILYLGVIVNNTFDSFVIITKEATTPVKGIHERIPVILNKSERVKWLKDISFARTKKYQESIVDLKIA